MSRHLQINTTIHAVIPDTRTYAVAFDTDYDISEYNGNVMDIQTFVETRRHFPDENKWALVELLKDGGDKHAGTGAESLSGVLLQSFPTVDVDATRNILEELKTYYVYIVTFQGVGGVNQTIKVVDRVPYVAP